MVDAFSLKFQRNNQQNALASDSARENLDKRLYFQCVVEIKGFVIVMVVWLH